MLNLDDGYDRVGLHWDDERKVQTRDADPQTTIRLARIAENGALVPWARGHGPEWKNWALSEIRVATRRVPYDAQPPDVHRPMVDRARGKWGKFEKDIPVIVLSQTAEEMWTGQLQSARPQKIEITYSYTRGLEWLTTER